MTSAPQTREASTVALRPSVAAENDLKLAQCIRSMETSGYFITVIGVFCLFGFIVAVAALLGLLLSTRGVANSHLPFVLSLIPYIIISGVGAFFLGSIVFLLAAVLRLKLRSQQQGVAGE